MLSGDQRFSDIGTIPAFSLCSSNVQLFDRLPPTQLNVHFPEYVPSVFLL